MVFNIGKTLDKEFNNWKERNMEKQKHTQGPWAQHGKTEFKPFIKDSQGEPVCEVSWLMKTSDEAQANAALIAAAPDLLKALKHAVNWHDQLTPKDLARYKAAIAKAEGRQHG